MPFQKMQWYFPVAVTLHNTEEAISMPEWAAAHRAQIPFHPDSTSIWLGLLCLNIAAFVVTFLSARKGKQSVWAYLLFGYAAAMLVNVLVPHVPAALVFKRYTPGLLTAVFLNMPLMSALLWKAVREQWVVGMKALAYALFVPVAIAGAILTLFRLSYS